MVDTVNEALRQTRAGGIGFGDPVFTRGPLNFSFITKNSNNNNNSRNTILQRRNYMGFKFLLYFDLFNFENF